jgi:hypothetical protein
MTESPATARSASSSQNWVLSATSWYHGRNRPQECWAAPGGMRGTGRDMAKSLPSLDSCSGRRATPSKSSRSMYTAEGMVCSMFISLIGGGMVVTMVRKLHRFFLKKVHILLDHQGQKPQHGRHAERRRHIEKEGKKEKEATEKTPPVASPPGSLPIITHPTGR